MNSKLIFINLLIDSLWTEDGFLNKVFDVSSPETLTLSRVNEFLGRYFARENDLIVVPGPSDEKYFELQELHFNLSPARFIVVPIPLDRIKEFAAAVKSLAPDVDSALFSGASILESNIVKELGIAKTATDQDIELVKKLNKKSYLLDLAKELSFTIPDSEIVIGKQIEKSECLFKSIISSGGSGIYKYEDLMKVKAWAIRKNLTTEWDHSQWIKQQVIEREIDINCFGHTATKEFNSVTIKYDQNRLSLRHDINFINKQSIETPLKEVFDRVRNNLIEEGYSGYFGFDSIVGKGGILYPVVDLNVRMNKSHVLHQISKCIKFPEPYISFFRLRFINNRWLNFRDFWSFLDKEADKVFFKTEGAELIPVDWSYWNLGKSECLMALSSTQAASADEWDAYLSYFVNSQRGQNV